MAHRAEIEGERGQHHPPLGGRDHPVERLADHGGVLVELLLHEMAEAALANRRPRKRGQTRLAHHFRSLGVEEAHAFAPQHRPVAILQIGDAAGEGSEGEGI